MAKRSRKTQRSQAARRAVSHASHVTLGEVTAAMETIAPLHLAEPWDNVGLLAGEKSARIKRILLAIDLAPAVYKEALRAGVDLLIAYHPPIFKPLNTLRTDSQEPAALAIKLVAHGIAIYCPHTALDTADGGTNDALAKVLGAHVTGSFSHHPGKGSYLKLVTFVPEESVERVAEAVYSAGAGNIGIKSKYSQCSFRTRGTGTFFGDASTNPAVGRKGELERVPEIRFETILPATHAGNVVRALYSAHPYEEPAFDLLKMETPPEAVGLGRFATLPAPMTLSTLAKHAKQKMKLKAISVNGNLGRPVKSLAVMAGSAGRIPLDVAFPRQSFDCLITGELKHHDALAYHAAGIEVVCLGHAESEQPILPVVQKTLLRQFPAIRIAISKSAGNFAHVL